MKRFISLFLAVIMLLATLTGCGGNGANKDKANGSDNIEVNTEIPIGAIISCFFGEIALVLLVSGIMLSVLGARPPLVLVQTGTQRREAKRKIKKEKKESSSSPVNL